MRDSNWKKLVGIGKSPFSWRNVHADLIEKSNHYWKSTSKLYVVLVRPRLHIRS
jgi:hypothetical protein